MAAAHGVHVIYGFEETDDADDRRDLQLRQRRRPATASSARTASCTWASRWRPIGSRPANALPVFDTDLGPIGISICYDFYNNPELCRVLALKGARLLVNPTGRSDLPRAASTSSRSPWFVRTRTSCSPRPPTASAPATDHPPGRAAA